ncbi:ABC transporter permease [Pontibacter sp. BT310]|uniref:ABC transporter permease n=1 Tax=Pontibacter populi TaxID=890055 RepID=A0ABS6XBE6_9BACT|nr:MULTISPECIES: ABC transporter permease [Pontibacter]MBJ6118471.1 ABC transporter permease [Pontibacter sp. BT310]MBR0570900.1 ABC transporter permease [Microvirga sp. STS03]MBW3365325.1 ABC transporter permease [Pontibacter populi]
MLDIAELWRRRWSFKIALLYLLALLILVLVLPFLPLLYTPNQLDLENVFLKPFESSTHVFGTDQLGRDVLVNTLHGARNGLLIALPVMLISSFIGTTIGALAGYFGNNKINSRRGSLLIVVCCVLLLLYYVLHVPLQVVTYDLSETIVYISFIVGTSICLFLWYAIRPLLNRLSSLRAKAKIPFDSITLRSIELLTSLPKLLILISVSAFAPPSVMLLSVVLICTYWTGTARLSRAEMLRIKQLPYMEAALSTGMSHKRIIFKEAIPNLISPVVVAFIFGVGGLLAIESTLSFLGIGLPATFPSWGRTIAGIRSNLSAWWLVAFPGGFLALTVLALQICSYHLVRITQERGR